MQNNGYDQALLTPLVLVTMFLDNPILANCLSELNVFSTSIFDFVVLYC